LDYLYQQNGSKAENIRMWFSILYSCFTTNRRANFKAFAGLWESLWQRDYVGVFLQPCGYFCVYQDRKKKTTLLKKLFEEVFERRKIMGCLEAIFGLIFGIIGIVLAIVGVIIGVVVAAVALVIVLVVGLVLGLLFIILLPILIPIFLLILIF